MKKTKRGDRIIENGDLRWMLRKDEETGVENAFLQQYIWDEGANNHVWEDVQVFRDGGTIYVEENDSDGKG